MFGRSQQKFCKIIIFQLKIIFLKRGRKPEEILFQKHMNGQKVQKKVLNITHQQGNANENYSETSSHTCQDSHYQKDKR